MQHEHAEFGLTDAQGTLQHRLEHRLQLTGRGADDLEDLSSRCFALARFGELAGELFDVGFLGGSYRTAMACGLWRIAVLQHLGALGFCLCAACFVGPPHCLPRGSGKGIVATKTSCGRGESDPMSALGH